MAIVVSTQPKTLLKQRREDFLSAPSAQRRIRPVRLIARCQITRPDPFAQDQTPAQPDGSGNNQTGTPADQDPYQQGYQDGQAWAQDPNRGPAPPLVLNPDYINGFYDGAYDAGYPDDMWNQQDDKVVSPNDSGNVPVSPVAVFDDGEGESEEPWRVPGGGGASPPPESPTPGSGGGEPVPEPVQPGGEPVPVEPVSPQIRPGQLAGKTPAEIDQMARSMGLVPQGPDPMNGQGSYTDPVTGNQRIRDPSPH